MSKRPDLSRLEAVFSRYEGVTAVYLFGSVADGKTHPGSDLDLAIVPRSSALRQQKLNILTDLVRAGFDNVDLVLLDTNDITLKFEAVRRNRLIYAVPEFDHGSYFSKVIRQYFDFEPYLKIQREAYKKRILDGQKTNHPQTAE
ncbi:MAG: nucleotidyltransferase domain-containing protein [Ardenticatenaceae bacterium]|nr:nucleotidyltransferase domain-containing protein [Ardenticatenaceae bacterium]MCB8986781.1 nucleotidyltransferase domain-containing protein [Ardenticatenaceae bacterium]